MNFCSQSVIVKLKEGMSVKQNVELQNECQEKPKLRTFITIKDFGLTPCYITMPMPFLKRKFLALSQLAIRLETERGSINGLAHGLACCECNVESSICAEEGSQ
jgi:hypothetical protein